MCVQRLTSFVAIVAATSFGLAVGNVACAQSASGADAEIVALKRQLQLMEQKLDQLQKQTAANTTAAAKANAKADAKVAVARASAAYPVKGPVAPSDVVVKMPNNRPTICTADDQNCVSITSRLHFDAGGYDYRPNTAATTPQHLNDGVNARRARIGVIGKFMGDWNYALVYDFAGSSDGFAGTGSAGGTAVGFLPGGGLSGIENAYLSYTGFKPFGGTLAIEGGYADVPYTLDEATSSNDIMFMERSSAQVIAINIAAGDARCHVRRTLVQRQVMGRCLCDGTHHGCDSLRLERKPERHDRTIWCGCPCRGAGHQRSGLLPAHRSRCRVSDHAGAQSDNGGTNAHLERSPGTASRPDRNRFDGSACGCIGCSSL